MLRRQMVGLTSRVGGWASKIGELLDWRASKVWAERVAQVERIAQVEGIAQVE